MRNGDSVLQSKKLLRKVRTAGFTYVLLLVLIAVIALLASSSIRFGAQMSRRDAEQSLLFVGSEFSSALRSYAAFANSPASSMLPAAAALRGPRTLEELLKDNRSPVLKRHLRKIYADPMTGLENWGLVKDPAGFIVGVYSLAPGRPIQQTGFDAHLSNFEEAQTYADWVFASFIYLNSPVPSKVATAPTMPISAPMFSVSPIPSKSGVLADTSPLRPSTIR
jgi:type II secretory pathway pseudopilin PulG